MQSNHSKSSTHSIAADVVIPKGVFKTQQDSAIILYFILCVGKFADSVAFRGVFD
jgi:hypothetical protein